MEADPGSMPVVLRLAETEKARHVCEVMSWGGTVSLERATRLIRANDGDVERAIQSVSSCFVASHACGVMCDMCA